MALQSFSSYHVVDPPVSLDYPAVMENERAVTRKNCFSWPLAAAGWLCIGLGVAGIFLPLLPTVPLLLLAAACFARSSPSAYAWLLDHPRLGPLVAGYLDGSGIPLRAKVMAISLIWISVSCSLYFAALPSWVRIIVVAVAGGVSLYLLRLPTFAAEAGKDD